MISLTETKAGAICRWAQKKGVCIKHTTEPRIICLQGGGVAAGRDRISVLIVLPKPRTTDQSAEASAEKRSAHGPLFHGTMKSPAAVGGPHFVESRFDCQVGDIIILEAEEQILVDSEGRGDLRDHNISMLGILHHTCSEEGLLRRKKGSHE